jgi:hypothetical protein
MKPDSKWIRLYEKDPFTGGTGKLVFGVVEVNGMIESSPPGIGVDFKHKCAGAVYDYAAKHKYIIEIEDNGDPF